MQPLVENKVWRELNLLLLLGSQFAYYKLLIAQYMYPMLLHNVASGIHVHGLIHPQCYSSTVLQ